MTRPLRWPDEQSGQFGRRDYDEFVYAAQARLIDHYRPIVANDGPHYRTRMVLRRRGDAPDYTRLLRRDGTFVANDRANDRQDRDSNDRRRPKWQR